MVEDINVTVAPGVDFDNEKGSSYIRISFAGNEKDLKIALNKIDIEYFILKRKLYEKVDFPQRRIQTFVPANGTPSINKVNLRLKDFIEECFTENGEYNLNTTYRKEPSEKNCRFCEFKNKPDLCDRRK